MKSVQLKIPLWDNSEGGDLPPQSINITRYQSTSLVDIDPNWRFDLLVLDLSDNYLPSGPSAGLAQLIGKNLAAS